MTAPTLPVSIPEDRIAVFCHANGIAGLALFGSVLRDDCDPDSDIDILVRFEAEARPTLFDFGRMERELAAIFGRDVDLVSWRAIERSANAIRRNAILNAAEPIYRS
ncbi:MAG: nucleotidyltransferase domain-containing protein [Rhodospirillaceae bacterium]|nr:nucleotidyltransferase domain-containing protein [Rhodospirillaceae bacterium]